MSALLNFLNGYMRVIVLAIAIANYVCKAIGLYVLAKSTNSQIKWMAFVPIVNSYLLGKLSGPTSIFTTRIKNTHLMLFLTHLAYFLLEAAIFLLQIIPNIKIILVGEVSVWQLITGNYSFENLPIAALNIMQVFFYLATFAFVIMHISALMTLFRKYEPNSYFAYSLLSVLFNIEGFFIFAIRNKTAIDYNEYMRERYQRYVNSNQNPNGYGNQNPYNPYNNQQPNAPEPFSDFKQGKPQGPFSEFDNDNTPQTDTKDENKSHNDSNVDF